MSHRAQTEHTARGPRTDDPARTPRRLGGRGDGAWRPVPFRGRGRPGDRAGAARYQFGGLAMLRATTSSSTRT
ncbi:hypothetical protein, partial [Streptomyces kronopolitis]